MSLYCRFNEIIVKGTGTSFQSPALSQKHVRNVFRTEHYRTLINVTLLSLNNSIQSLPLQKPA